MIVTSFTLRSPCSWKLQYVRSSVLVEPLQRCTCTTKVDVALPLHRRITSTSTPPHLSTFTSSHAHIRRSTSLHLTTPTHLHIYITSVHPHSRSFTSVLSFFLSTYLLSRLCAFTSSYAHIHRSTSPPPYIHRSMSHLRITLSLLHIHPLFLSFYTSFRLCWTITCLALGPTIV